MSAHCSNNDAISDTHQMRNATAILLITVGSAHGADMACNATDGSGTQFMRQGQRAILTTTAGQFSLTNTLTCFANPEVACRSVERNALGTSIVFVDFDRDRDVLIVAQTTDTGPGQNEVTFAAIEQYSMGCTFFED